MNSGTSTSRPLLTIAIAAGARDDHVQLCNQLREAGLLDRPEVQVCVAHAGEQWGDPDGAVEVIAHPRGTPVFRLYRTLLEQTDSLYVALLDAGCPPTKRWLNAALERIRGERDVFYGPVDPGWGPDDPRIVGYLVEYAQFRRPLERTLTEYPGNNIVFRRELLASAPPDRAGFQKTFFLRHIEHELGIRPEACDDMSVVYRKSYEWRYYLRRRLRHGRLYGSSHARSLGRRRFLYAGGSLVLPALRCWRILRAARRDSALLRSVLHFSARIVASECAWSMGECQGYLAGSSLSDAYLD